MRIALLSNVTVDLLADMVKKNHDVYLAAGFDTWQQEIILPTSGLYEFKPEAIVVLLHADAYVWDSNESGRLLIDEWCSVFKTLISRVNSIPVFVSSIDIRVRCAYGAANRFDTDLENYYNERIQEMHQNGASIYILPVKEAITNCGRNSFYSEKMWYIGSMPYSIKGLTALEELIGHYATLAKGTRKKCLAVDLDNTLWGGVIGEDGVEGIMLSNHKEGARFYDTQKLLKLMKEQGVMLAILSKNNVEDVEPVFSHPDMVLQHEDFVAEVINWNSKASNIRQLAKNLNIGLDSFVFLDDNPAEREQMMAECPEVTVIDFPKDSSQLPAVVERAYREYFQPLELTGEDVNKTAMYRAESLRKAEMAASPSVEVFLKKLEMSMDIHIMRPEEEKRDTQLTNKTNQFNLTTKRYSEEEISELAKDGDIITVHMSDKYGDQGLVAVLILKYKNDEADIDTFLMSCRVMGRNTENEIIARVKGYLNEKGIKRVGATYIKTAKNMPVVELYDKLGFTLVAGEINEIGDKKEYIANVSDLPLTTGVFKSVVENWT